MQAGRAGRRIGKTRSLEIAHNGNLTGNHIGDTARNQERRNSTWSFFQIGTVVDADCFQSADSAADSAARSHRGFFINLKSAVIQSLKRSRHSVLNKAVKTTRFFRRKILLHFKILDFTGDAGAESGRIKVRHRSDAGFTRQRILPTLLYRVANRADHAQAGNDYSTH